jgi:hypothetical protein
VAPLPEPLINDEVREGLKSTMKETGAPDSLIAAIGTVDVSDEEPPQPARDQGGHSGAASARRRRFKIR